MIRYALILLSAVLGLHLSAQDWLPMDRGLHCPSLAAGTGTVREFVIDEPNNQLYAIGVIRYNGYCEEIHIVSKWTESAWEQVGTAVSYTGFTGAHYRDSLFVYGQIAPNVAGSQMYRLDENDWSLLNEQPNSTINEMRIYDDTLFLSGTFTSLGNDSTFLVGKYYDGQFYGITRPYPDAGTFCYAIAHYQGHLYMGGNFTLHPDDGVPQTFSNFARVEGDEVVAVGNQFLNEGTTSVIYDLEVFEDELYIAGGFYVTEGYSSDNIMKWNGEEFLPVGSGAGHNIRDLHVYNDELYALGLFSSIDGDPCKYIAKWDGNDWTCLNQTPLDNENEVVNFQTLTVYNNQLIVGGKYTTVNGDSLNSVAIIDGTVGLGESDATVDSPFVLFPNPSEGDIVIEGPFEIGREYELAVFDGLGRLVSSRTEIAMENRMFLQLSTSLRNGVYKLRISANGNVISQKSFSKR